MAWGDPREEKVEQETIWMGKGAGYYLPAAGKQQIIVIAPPAEIREIPATGGQAPPLRRELEALLSATDSERDLNLIFAPNFTFSGAKALFTEQGAKLQEPLDAFLVMENADKRLELPKAASLSIHLAEDSFVEFRVYNSYAGRPMGAVVEDFRDRITHLPKQVSQYVRDLYLSDYSKPVLWDYKDQLEVLARYARAGVDGKQVVLRAYLPPAAAHNLALGRIWPCWRTRATAVLWPWRRSRRPKSRKRLRKNCRKRRRSRFLVIRWRCRYSCWARTSASTWSFSAAIYSKRGSPKTSRSVWTSATSPQAISCVKS